MFTGHLLLPHPSRPHSVPSLVYPCQTLPWFFWTISCLPFLITLMLAAPSRFLQHLPHLFSDHLTSQASLSLSVSLHTYLYLLIVLYWENRSLRKQVGWHTPYCFWSTESSVRYPVKWKQRVEPTNQPKPWVWKKTK